MQSSQNRNQVIKFLSLEKRIRVYTDASPGLGNQAAADNLINHFRTLGFKGIVEFIYPDNVRDKIETIFNLPSDATPNYYDVNKGIKFIALSKYLKNLNDNKIKLLNIGAAVVTGSPNALLPEQVRESLQDVEINIGNNPANFARVKVFHMFGPYMSGKKYSDTKIFYIDTINVLLQEYSRKKYYILPSIQFNDLDKHLDKHQILKTKPAIETYINGIKNNKYGVISVYGHTVQKSINFFCDEFIKGKHAIQDFPPKAYTIFGKGGMQVCWRENNFPGNIMQVIAGTRYAQLNNENKSPMIISVFYNYTQEMNEIYKLISSGNWTEYEFLGINNIEKATKELNLSNQFLIADLSDPATIDILNHLNKDQILLLSMGSLHKNIFEPLYQQGVSIREGASTFNLLAATGKPHIHCGNEWEIGFDLVKNPELKSQLITFNSKICRGTYTWQKDPLFYEQIGKYILDAQNPNSTLTQYFRDLQEDVSKPENDRILYGLQAGIASLQVQKDTITSTALALPDDSLKTSELVGKWSDIIEKDPNGESIYTFEVYDNDNVTGSIKFYGQPFLCASADKSRTNVIEATGIFADQITEDMPITKVCYVLPRSLFDKVLSGSINGVVLGSIDGVSNVIGVTLKSTGTPQRIANLTKNIVYYALIFNMRLFINLNNNLNNKNLNQRDDAYDDINLLNALVNSAVETGHFFLINQSLDIVKNCINKLSQMLEQRNYSIPANICKVAANLTKLGFFAYRNGRDPSNIVEASTSLVAGGVTKYLIELIQPCFSRKPIANTK